MTRKCIVCGKTHEEIPVTKFYYKETEFYICPQHIPMLIHKPTELADMLPGAEEFPAG